MRSLDRFHGCLLAGAAGDALGYEVEFANEADIFMRYGEQGITRYGLRNGGRISDDTQMTLFTATGVLLGAARGTIRGTINDYMNYLDYIRYSYKDWYRTQTEQYPLTGEYHFSWLVNEPRLFSRRAPGRTCLLALGSDEKGTITNRINHSKGCGGVMRVAPIGLFACGSDMDILDSDSLGAEAAAITHGHDLGWIPAAALAHIVRRLAEDENETVLSSVTGAMEAIQVLFPDSDYLAYQLELMQKAIDLSQEERDDLDAIHLLGQGWVAEETLAIAIYCALKYPDDIEKALIAAVNHIGDSDSTGAVTGNILGAALGESAIPEKYLKTLELRDVITEVADDLYYSCRMGRDGYDDPVWTAKYFDMNYSPAR